MNVQTEVELDLGLREWLRVCFLETSVQIMQKEEKIRHYEQTYRVANENLTVWWQIWGRDASVGENLNIAARLYVGQRVGEIQSGPCPDGA